MKTTTTIAIILSTLALFTTACGNADDETYYSASSEVEACCADQVAGPVCYRVDTMGSCTEYRGASGEDLAEAEAACAATDGVFMPSSMCPVEDLLGTCPVGDARHFYYQNDEIFKDPTLPKAACKALNEGAWCGM